MRGNVGLRFCLMLLKISPWQPRFQDVSPFKMSLKGRDFRVTDIYLVIKHLVCGKNIFQLCIFCIVLIVVVVAKVSTKIAKHQFHVTK